MKIYFQLSTGNPCLPWGTCELLPFRHWIKFCVFLSCLDCQILCTVQATVLTFIVSIFVSSFYIDYDFPRCGLYLLIFLSHLRSLLDSKNDINILEQIIRCFRSFVGQSWVHISLIKLLSNVNDILKPKWQCSIVEREQSLKSNLITQNIALQLISCVTLEWNYLPFRHCYYEN